MKKIGFYIQDALQDFGKGIEGICTGIKDVDKLTLGFKSGELVLIGGRMSLGKSSILADIALQASENGPVLLFSMEMAAKVMTQRIICMTANIGLHDARLNGVDIDKIQPALDKLSKKEIYLPQLEHDTLEEVAACLKKAPKPAVILVDYLQMIHIPNFYGRKTAELDTIGKKLKLLALEYECPVISPVQLNRVPEGREDHRPTIADIRDCDALAHHADIILLVHRPEWYEKKEYDLRPPVEKAFIIIGKNRQGPCGQVECRFHSKFMSFRDRDSTTFFE